ncbi:MAG: DMT family transporter [Rhodospirillaceae bacterium]|jgi:drug/metabolite transporter (DMT)-like permease|nr:DMT family transporter [Rhodospirillaceae bacterium]MBT5080752.1 DMT family transporter [Rhodospirillaceae bacterium]MBT5525174.1 DMT family transporter [Rhodospirillaceae bacterium]MBT5877743.1 DMT family transporter [Rhodospirillaceae bacterium]MBT6912010.1 DMT family transporter [Rhodospirillaceae bacterium]
MPDWIGQSVQNNPFKGILLMNLAMFLLAGMDGITKTLAADYAVPQILSIRFLIFCLFALAVARPKSFRQAFRSKHPYLQITRSLIIVIEVGVFIIAFRHLPLADAHAIAGIAPLLVTALAVPFLGERVGARRWGAIAIGFLGLLVIVRPGIGIFDPTALIPLAGASLWAIYQILMRKVSDDSAATSLLYMAVTGAVVMTILAPFFWQPPDTTGWLLLISLGVVGSLGHYILIEAFKAAPASTLQPFHYIVLLWATAIGYLVFGDLPDLWTVLGAGIIAASGLYAFYREQKAKS